MIRPGRHNPIWKRWRRVGGGKCSSLYFLEHKQAVLGALEQGQLAREYLLSESLHRESPDFWEELERRYAGVPWYLVPDESLDRVVSVPACSGFVGVFEPLEWSADDLLESPFVFAGWRLSDPGNVGALIRTCAALTGGGVLLVEGCNPWSSKVGRASAGSLLRCPVVRLSESGYSDFRVRAQRSGFHFHTAVPKGGRSPFGDFGTGKDIVLLGNESAGLPDEKAWQGTAWTVPMTSREESLNIGAAAAILAASWARTREASRCS